MKIPQQDPIHLLENYLFGVKGSDQGSADRRTEQPPSHTNDRVELSIGANELSKLNDSVVSIPEVRSNRVAEIRKQIETGTYNSKAERVAENLVRSGVVDAIL
jgi:negative regulator of flagellin synthesis FlgM